MLSRESKSNTPIPSTGQQRDALPIICIPCTGGERKEGSYKVIPQTPGGTSVAVRQCFEVRVWEVDDKRGRSERKGILEGGRLEQIACKTLAKHHGTVMGTENVDLI